LGEGSIRGRRLCVKGKASQDVSIALDVNTGNIVKK
jgi:hypothetical protein